MTDEEKKEVQAIIDRDARDSRWWKEIEIGSFRSRLTAHTVLIVLAYLLIGILLAKVLFL